MLILDCADKTTRRRRLFQIQTLDKKVKPSDGVPRTAVSPDRKASLALKLHRFSDNATYVFFRRAFSEELDHGHDFLWIAIAFIAGAYFNFTRMNDLPSAALLVPIIGFISLKYFIKQLNLRAKISINVVLVFLAGAMAANMQMQPDVILIDQDLTTNIEGYVVSRQLDGNGIPRYIIQIEKTAEPQIRRPPERVQLVAKSRHEIIEIGQYISGRTRLTRPSGPVFPGGYDFAFGAFQKEIGAYGFFLGAPKTSAKVLVGHNSFVNMFELYVRDIQAHIAGRIQNRLNGDAAGIASALIVSDRRAISDQTVDALRHSGLAHVLAISGLHMVLAAGTLFISIRAIFSFFPGFVQSFAVKKLAATGAILAASAYLVISGAPVSAQRAWIMLMIVLIAVLIDRPAITLRNVAIAAVIIVILSPSAVMTPGFQMSFAAASALVAVYGGWARLADCRSEQTLLAESQNLVIKLFKIILGLAATAFIAGMATGVFSIQHFYQVAGHGVLGNMLAMPIITFLVMPLALVSVLLMPYGLEAWPLLLLGMSIDLVIGIATWVAQLGGNINSGKPISWAAFLASTGFITFIVMRSKLRYAGLLVMLCGMISVFVFRPHVPDMLISEDGKLIGLYRSGMLEVNRSRPSEFIIEQWLNAYRLQASKPDFLIKKFEANELLNLLDNEFWSHVPIIETEDTTFRCLNTHFCYAKNGLEILSIGKREYLAKACLKADIIVAAFRIYDLPEACQNRAIEIVDQNSLRKTGSLAIYLDENNTAQTNRNNFRIETAINSKVRPWTIQRYYDWRTRTYDLPDGRQIKHLTNIQTNAMTSGNGE